MNYFQQQLLMIQWIKSANLQQTLLLIFLQFMLLHIYYLARFIQFNLHILKLQMHMTKHLILLSAMNYCL